MRRDRAIRASLLGLESGTDARQEFKSAEGWGLESTRPKILDLAWNAIIRSKYPI